MGLAAGALGLVPWVVAVATLLLAIGGSVVALRRAERTQVPTGPPLALALLAAAIAAFV
ncbi:MAG TPA: hypothetical protein VNA20_18075 [Frankiaceae bacterium]|nr:hypothetical protein [Frankiaceae bacterium]